MFFSIPVDQASERNKCDHHICLHWASVPSPAVASMMPFEFADYKSLKYPQYEANGDKNVYIGFRNTTILTTVKREIFHDIKNI